MVSTSDTQMYGSINCFSIDLNFDSDHVLGKD